MKLSTDLKKRLEIIEKVEADEMPVFRCKCDNLSLDRKYWVIFMDTSVMSEDYSCGINNTLVMPHYNQGHYTLVTCDLCKAFKYIKNEPRKKD